MKDNHINKKIREFFFKKLLGKGNFGSVYLVEDTLNKTLAACKVINKDKIKEVPKLGQLVNNQIMVLYNCQDKNIVNYLASFQDEFYVYIVMEFCNGGDLDQHIQSKGGKLCEEDAKFILNQIIKGFKSIRAINAVHRDFKPENVLINNGVIKIADLGFSKIFTAQQDTTNTILGTLYTMAPEIIAKQAYGSQCDIWSIGAVYYKLLYGTYPYMGTTYAQMLKRFQSTKPQFNPMIKVSKQSIDFINRCLVIQPNKRITWQQIQNHPLISKSTPIVLPSLKIPEQVAKTQEFYIRNCNILRIKNPPAFPEVALSSEITQQRLNDPLQKKVLQNRIHSYYQMLYITIRKYVIMRVTFGLESVENLLSLAQLKNHISLQQHCVVGYILARQTLRQISDLLESLIRKDNVLQFTVMANEFFLSQQCKSLILLFKNDQNTLIRYVARFKDQMNKEDFSKLEQNQMNLPDKILQRQKRNYIQYSIQLFNNIDKVDKKIVVSILFLIQFLADQIQNNYKNPEKYSNFASNQDLKTIWSHTKQTLSRLKKNFQ